MNIENSIFLAIDTSYQQGAVALFRGDKILYERILDEKLAHGKLVCEAITTAMSLTDELAGVLCGLGPGSFVGVRVALATSLGFCFARNLPLMGFCSHEALAHSYDYRSDDFTLFMKASGDLGYLTNFRAAQKTAETKVLSIKDLREFHAIILSDVADRITATHPAQAVQNISGPTPKGIVRAARARMSLAQGFFDESSFIKPNYIKGPNISVPIPRAN